MKKKCIICGNTYECRGNSLTCSAECRKIRHRNVNNEWHRKNFPVAKTKRKLKDFHSGGLDDDIRKARELDISYGKYKAEQFLARESERLKSAHTSSKQVLPTKEKIQELAHNPIHDVPYEYRKQQFNEIVEQNLI